MFARLARTVAVPAITIAGALAVAVLPALGAGERTTATLVSPSSGTSDTFVWEYEFHQNGGHELSNLAIAFCDASVLDQVESAVPNGEVFKSGDVPGGHAGFGPGIKFDVTDPTGELVVVFKKEFGIVADGMRIQSHSGDGQEGDEATTAHGPDACPEDTTTTTTMPETTTTTVPETTTTTVPETTTTTVPETTTTTEPETTIAPQVLGQTEERPPPPPAVLPAIAELPRTGASWGLFYTGLILLVGGLVSLGAARLRGTRRALL